MDSPFEQEARAVLASFGYGQHEQSDILAVAEAIRAGAEKGFEDGYWAAEQDNFKRLTQNPYAAQPKESAVEPALEQKLCGRCGGTGRGAVCGRCDGIGKDPT